MAGRTLQVLVLPPERLQGLQGLLMAVPQPEELGAQAAGKSVYVGKEMYIFFSGKRVYHNY